MKINLKTKNKCIVKSIIILISVIGLFRLGKISAYSASVFELPEYYNLLVRHCDKLRNNTYNLAFIENDIKRTVEALAKNESSLRTMLNRQKKLEFEIKEYNSLLYDVTMKSKKNRSIVYYKEPIDESFGTLKLDDIIIYKANKLARLNIRVCKKQVDYDYLIQRLNNLYNNKDYELKNYARYRLKIVLIIKNIIITMLANKSTFKIPEYIEVNFKSIFNDCYGKNIVTKKEFYSILSKFYETKNSLDNYVHNNKCNYRTNIFNLFGQESNEATLACAQLCYTILSDGLY